MNHHRYHVTVVGGARVAPPTASLAAATATARAWALAGWPAFIRRTTPGHHADTVDGAVELTPQLATITHGKHWPWMSHIEHILQEVAE